MIRLEPASRLALALLLAVALTSGCGRDEIQVYSVPKEQQPATEAGLPPGHPAVAAPAASPQLKWKTPEGWKEIPPGTIRVASFQIAGKGGKQADVSVIPLPGSAGGDLSNVNRWRGQVGQAPVSEEELKKLAQPIEVAGQKAELYEQGGDSGGDPTRILAAIQHRDGTAWFFKVTGDNELVAQAKPAFVEFLRSLQFATGEASPAPPSAGKPQWTAPPGWKEVPGGQFLVAKFVIAGEGTAQAAVNVSSSAGDGGGLAANVNRWRKQLGLGELSGEEIARSVTKAGEAAFIEINGDRASLAAAIVTRPGETWFYKLMGDASIVTAQKVAFMKFVQEVKY